MNAFKKSTALALIVALVQLTSLQATSSSEAEPQVSEQSKLFREDQVPPAPLFDPTQEVRLGVETLDMVRQAEVMAILLLLPAPWILTIVLFKALRKLPDEEPRLSTAWTQRARLVMMVLALSGVAYVLLFLSLRLVVAVSGTSS